MKQKSKISKLKRKVEGITLIALVVTIIVLLILSGVAINLTIGSNGIFIRGQNAVDKYEEASMNDQKELNSVVEYMDTIGKETVIEAYKQGKINLRRLCKL